MRNTLKILTALLLVPLPAIHAADAPKPGDAVTTTPVARATVTEQRLPDGSIEPKNSIEQWRALGYEHCDKISGKWFFVEGDQPRPVSDLVKLYQNVRATGGNLLLNVPPDPTGRIPEYHVKALMELREGIK